MAEKCCKMKPPTGRRRAGSPLEVTFYPQRVQQPAPPAALTPSQALHLTDDARLAAMTAERPTAERLPRPALVVEPVPPPPPPRRSWWRRLLRRRLG